MDFVYQYGLSSEEVDYVNGLMGYELEKEDGIIIRSTKEKIYSDTIQFGHPDPDLGLDDIEVIIYKDQLIKLQYRRTRGKVHFSEIFVPRNLKNEEDRIMEVIKEIQILKGTGRGGDPSKVVVEYPNGFPLIYYNETEVTSDVLFWEVHQHV